MNKLLMLGTMVGLGVVVAKFMKRKKEQGQDTNSSSPEQMQSQAPAAA